jgi:hypothetical protein
LKVLARSDVAQPLAKRLLKTRCRKESSQDENQNLAHKGIVARPGSEQNFGILPGISDRCGEDSNGNGSTKGYEPGGKEHNHVEHQQFGQVFGKFSFSLFRTRIANTGTATPFSRRISTGNDSQSYFHRSRDSVGFHCVGISSIGGAILRYEVCPTICTVVVVSVRLSQQPAWLCLGLGPIDSDAF